MSKRTLTLNYAQRAGAVDRIISLLRRRGFPIAGMTLERTHLPGVGRMTVVVGIPTALEQVTRHLERLADVIEVSASEPDDAVQREFVLARVRCSEEQQPHVMNLLTAFTARALHVGPDEIVVEATGTAEEIDALFTQLEPYGIEESARTNPVALRRASTDVQRKSA
ncbi:MAG: acetolactate synthase small subunit [Chloroflexota bacterium]